MSLRVGTSSVAVRLARRPLAAAAAALVALESALALLGAEAAAISLLALLLAPGLALVPLMPARVRSTLVAVLAAAATLGFAATAVTLISLSSAGVELDGITVRVALVGIVAVGLALPGDDPRTVPRGDALAAAGLMAALLIGVLLQREVIGGSPVPGNDWAKYVLYADEIRAHGSLLIDNPFWMLGVPFREDPASPAVEGAFLILTGQPAGILVHGIWVMALMSIGSMFAFVRALWGPLAGALAAAFLAVLPISQDILAWHGLANAAALAVLPLVLLYLTLLTRDGVDLREASGFALLLVALAAAHRLSFVVGLLAVGLALALALVTEARARAARGVALTALWLVVLAPGVAHDLADRARTLGGTQGYQAYLSAKVNLGPVAGDLSVVFTALAIGAIGFALVRVRDERALVPVLCFLGVVVALAYGWLLHVPAVYFRMAYFLPVALVPLVAYAITRALPPRRGLVSGAVAVATIAVLAWIQAADVRDFYDFTNRTSLQGLDAVAAKLRPREVVVTDRCWSFQAAWLLHTPTLAALEPEDIGPKAEVPRARQARAVLDWTPAGRAAARRLGIRFLIVDPTCTDTLERPTRPPGAGSPVFVSKRLVVLRLPGP